MRLSLILFLMALFFTNLSAQPDDRSPVPVSRLFAQPPERDTTFVLRETLTTDWTGAGWVDQSRTRYQYNEDDGLVGLMETEVWSTEEQSWLPSTRTIYTYDNQHRLTEELIETFSGSWRPQSRVSREYDQQGNVYRYTYYSYQSNAWQPSYRMTYTYDNGWIADTLLESYSSGWVTFNRTVYNWTNGLCQATYTDRWDTGTWVPYSRNYYTYNDADLQTELLMEVWLNNAWQPYYLNETDYSGLHIVSTSYNRENTGWVPLIQWETFRDEYGNDQWVLYRNREENQWVDDYRTQYYYDSVNIPDQDQFAPETPAVRLFPNPSRSTVSLLLSAPAETPCTIEVYNIRGEKVCSEAGVRATGTWTWSGRDTLGRVCPSGLYLFRVQIGDSRLFTTKALLIK